MAGWGASSKQAMFYLACLHTTGMTVTETGLVFAQLNWNKWPLTT